MARACDTYGESRYSCRFSVGVDERKRLPGRRRRRWEDVIEMDPNAIMWDGLIWLRFVSHIIKPTHTHTHTLQNPHIHTPTHYKTHTYTHPRITKPTHTHTHTHYKTHTNTHTQ
jgi:hypothetical protein